jgi:hypothetical protein
LLSGNVLRKEVVSKWLQQWKAGKKRKRRVMELLGRATTLGDTGWSREPSDHERAECEAFRRRLAEILDAKVKRTKNEMERRRKVARKAPAVVIEIKSEEDLQRVDSEALNQVADDENGNAVVRRSEEEVEDMDLD